MKKQKKAIAGVFAPAARPTPLGAALVAVIITFPVAVSILVMDLLLL